MSLTPCKNCEHVVFYLADECENCGVMNPGAKFQATGDNLPSPTNPEIGLLGDRASKLGRSSGTVGMIAKRLKRENQVAISWLYGTAWIATVIFALAFFFILFSKTDGWSKFAAFLGASILIMFTWVQTMIVAPFYSYMSMRANEVLERND